MADLLDALRTPEPGLTLPPADEVRRRGDRLRRRRRTWQVAGAAAAVAVVVGGGALLGAGDTTPRDLPVTRPSTTPPISTAVPSGLPITSGWPDPGGDGSIRVGRMTFLVQEPVLNAFKHGAPYRFYYIKHAPTHIILSAEALGAG